VNKRSVDRVVIRYSVRASVALALVAATAAGAAAPAPEQELEEVVVTGFRASLGAALQAKRESVSSVDAIVAEDIAKFPDQNLAESLQRIPGISILRDGGEGRAITVRGLGAQFTRVRVNGMETVATSTDGASANRDRAFDFNVFASELFSGIVVHKTAEASLDEGSLGAVVDLNTGNPLSGKAGFTLVNSLQMQNNSLSKDWSPRVAALVSWRNDAGTFGYSVSGAYSTYRTLELGNNTVRWQQARFDSVNGTPCFYTNATSTTPAVNTGGTYRASAGCDAAALAFHPRIPRYGEVAHDRDRKGLTASLQWAPSDSTLLSVDGLASEFSEIRDEKWGEVLFRSLERQIDVTSYRVDANHNLVSGTFNDVPVRLERYQRESTTNFGQLGARLEQKFSDSFRSTLLVGSSKAEADIPVETTMILDDKNGQNYSYDYSDSRHPLLAFGTSVSDPANFQLSEIRDRPSTVTNRFRTASLGAEWDITPWATLKTGGVYRRFGFDSIAYSRDTAVCTAAGADRVLGTLTCSATSNISNAAVYGFPINSSMVDTFVLGNAGQPSGTTSTWIVPNLPATTAFTRLYSRPLVLDVGNNRSVVERATGGYVQLDGRNDILDRALRYNLGVRYVKTRQSSTGIQSSGTSVAPVTIVRTYDDWLPAVNLAYSLSNDLVVRAAASKVLTRPTLGNLTPGGTVDGFNYRVSFGNPQLEPFRANAFDVSIEYYFAPEAIFSVALFKKDVKSFPVASTSTGTFASTGLPTSTILPSSPAAANPEAQPWTITSIVNGKGAELKGMEVALQSPFRFLPGRWSNFGGIVNATYIDSDADYTIGGPAIAPGGALISAVRHNTLLGVSRRAYNGTLYYEEAKFSARVSASYRSRFVDATSATGNFFEGYNSSLNIDASLKYRFSEAVEVSLEGINLTDDYRDRFTDIDSDRVYENNHFGRTILLGVRYKR
jgi:iron complex outermembrane recepter protein